MLSVDFDVVGVDEDVVEVDDNTNIEHVSEDIIHEFLECCWGVGESEGHDLPFKRSIAHSECGLPLITFGYGDRHVEAQSWCRYGPFWSYPVSP